MTRAFISTVVAILASGFTLNVQAEEPEANAGEWKFISNKDGVTIHRRQRPASNESR